MKYLIVLNALSYNRGSEALVRGLVKIIKNQDPRSQIVVSAGVQGDIQPLINGVDRIVPRIGTNIIIRKLITLTSILNLPNKFLYGIQCKSLTNELVNTDRVLIIGADNYDYKYKMFKVMSALNSLILSKIPNSAKIFLIDCSFNKQDLTTNVIKDIQRFKKITVRETISYNSIKEIVDYSKVKLFPDPAFVMNSQKCYLPEGFAIGNTIGLNLSDLVAGLSDRNILIANYLNTIEYILKNDKYTILLLPHVMNGSDFNILNSLYDMCIDKGFNMDRVILWENDAFNSEQIKYVISKLRFLITARTHASIAAYSTCVPTLVLGYSVKSIGIACDIFGSSNHYVVKYDDLKTEKDLMNAFLWLEENESNVKKTLEKVIPQYKQKAYQLGQLMKDGE